MDIEQKIRQIVNEKIREIHGNIQPALSMGDVATYVGQPMTDALIEISHFIDEQHKA